MKTNYLYKIEEEKLIDYIDEINITDRDREVVVRFINEKTTYRAIGESFNISHERVRQIVERFARKAYGAKKREEKAHES